MNGSQEIGIEVTQLFHPPTEYSKYPRQQVADFRRKLTARAQDLALAEGVPVYDVLVYVWNYEPRTALESAARSLVDFVKAHPVDDRQTWDRLMCHTDFA